MEIVSFNGWDRCARFVNGDAEMIVTLEVGPRILRLGKVDGPNLMFTIPPDQGQTGGDEYRFYGGHRIWVAPEHPVRSMQPDNVPLQIREEGDVVILTGETDKFGIQKELSIALTDVNVFSLAHTVINHGPYAASLAVWSPTQCAPGGKVHFPQAPYQPHTENLLPVRPLVLWAYTDLEDPRYRFGRTVATLTQDSTRPPTKVGTFVAQGYAAYEGHGSVFVKTFGAEVGTEYPDMGCNFETFTNEDMIEIESLGKNVVLGPFGGSECHKENWRLVPDTTLPTEDAALGERLEALADPIRLH